eukprot:scaffold759_cov290-Alexandrium_tamarense.AAC.31
MSMRAWAFLIAPAIAGYLSDPFMVRDGSVRVHDDEDEKGLANNHNSMYQLLQTYPFLLPNLLGTVLCWATAVTVFLEMPETLVQCRSLRLLWRDLSEWICKFLRVASKCWCFGRNNAMVRSSACSLDTTGVTVLNLPPLNNLSRVHNGCHKDLSISILLEHYYCNKQNST